MAHEIEPELAAPTPRRVEPRDGLPAGVVLPLGMLALGLVMAGIAVDAGAQGLGRVALVWCGLCLAALATVYGPHVRRRRLYVHGAVALGRLVSKVDDRDSEGGSILLRYAYRPGPGPEREARLEAALGQAEFEALREGQPLTVLYDPARPGRSTLYAFGGYRVVAGASSPARMEK